MTKRAVALSTLVLLLGGAARADAPAPAPSTPAERQVLEVTFGSSLLFAHQSLLSPAGRTHEEIIPVPSALLMVEWLARERFSVLSLINFPLEPQKTLSNGVIQEQYDAPSAALGVRVSAIRLEVFTASRLELQVAALAGVTVGSQYGDKLFPLAAARIHFCNRDGFALYVGGAYAFHKDTVALLYGFGHRF